VGKWGVALVRGESPHQAAGMGTGSAKGFPPQLASGFEVKESSPSGFNSAN
jgi:hypothetical protein